MGQESSCEICARNIQELLQAKGIGFEEGRLEDFLDQIYSCCPWFQEKRTLNERTWERIGNSLKAAKADNITLCLWTLIKDIIDEGGLEELDIIQEIEESQEESLPDWTPAKEAPPHPKAHKRRDSADEPIVKKTAHPKK